MRAVAGWTDAEAYSRFLSLQYKARASIETWLERHAADDQLPPAQCPLIARDLEQLGKHLPADIPNFAFGMDAGSSMDMAVLGIGWVLAGSSLGNRAILHDLRRKGFAEWPHSFLGDPEMVVFWNRLRPLIEKPVDDETLKVVAQAARATFDHFLAIAGDDSAADIPIVDAPLTNQHHHLSGPIDRPDDKPLHASKRIRA